MDYFLGEAVFTLQTLNFHSHADGFHEGGQGYSGPLRAFWYGVVLLWTAINDNTLFL
jgi:hypothetical protein